MADTFIQAPADGSGKKLDTRTEGTNSEHRQVVVIGDPATNAGVAPVDATTGLAVNVTNASLTVASHAVTNAGTFAVQAAQSGTWSTRLTDGTNTATVKAAFGAPSTGDTSITVGISPLSWDLGAGTSGSKTQRVIVDSGQLGTLGQTTMSASVPSAIATDQTVTVKGTATSNGLTDSRVVASASSNTSTNLKASAGNIFTIELFNVAAYDIFVKFYNKASAPTVGTDTPIWTVPIKAGTGYSKSFPIGKSFATGISFGITKLQADSDTTALTASDVTGFIGWV